MRLPETYTELRKQTLEQEGMKYPGKALVAMELDMRELKTGCFPIFRQ